MIFSLTPDLPVNATPTKASLQDNLARFDAYIASVQARCVTEEELAAIKMEVLSICSEAYGVSVAYILAAIGGAINGVTSMGNTNLWMPLSTLVLEYRGGPNIWNGDFGYNPYWMANECYYPKGDFTTKAAILQEANYACLEAFKDPSIPALVPDTAHAIHKAFAKLTRMYAYSYAKEKFNLRGVLGFSTFYGLSATYYHRASVDGYWYSSLATSYAYHRFLKKTFDISHMRTMRHIRASTGEIVQMQPYGNVMLAENICIYDLPEYAALATTLDKYWSPSSPDYVDRQRIARKEEALSSLVMFLREYIPTHLSQSPGNQNGTSVISSVVDRVAALVGAELYRHPDETIVFDNLTGRYKRVHPDGKVITQGLGGDYHDILFVNESSSPPERIPLSLGIYKMNKMTSLEDFIAFRVAHPEVTWVRPNGYANSGCVDVSGWRFTGPNNPAVATGYRVNIGYPNGEYKLATEFEWHRIPEDGYIVLPDGTYPKGSIIIRMNQPQFYEGEIYAYAIRYSWTLSDVVVDSLSTATASPILERACYFERIEQDGFDELTGVYKRVRRGSAFYNSYNGVATYNLQYAQADFLSGFITNITTFLAKTDYRDIGGVSVVWESLPPNIVSALVGIRAALTSLREAIIYQFIFNPASTAVLAPFYDFVDFYHPKSIFSQYAGSTLDSTKFLSLPATPITLNPIAQLSTELEAYRASLVTLANALAEEPPGFIPWGPVSGFYNSSQGWSFPPVEDFYGGLIVMEEALNVYSRYLRRIPSLPDEALGELPYDRAFYSWRLQLVPIFYDAFAELLSMSDVALASLAVEEAQVAELRSAWFSVYLSIDPADNAKRQRAFSIGAAYGVEGAPYFISYHNNAAELRPVIDTYKLAVQEEVAREHLVLTDDPSYADAPIVEQIDLILAAVDNPVYAAAARIHRPDPVTGEWRYVNYYTIYASQIAGAMYVNMRCIYTDAASIHNRIHAISSVFPITAADAWLPLCNKEQGSYVYLQYLSEDDPKFASIVAAEEGIRLEMSRILTLFLAHNLDPYVALFGTVSVVVDGEDVFMPGVQALNPSSPYYPVSQWYAVDCLAVFGTTSFEWYNQDFATICGANPGFISPIWLSYRWPNFNIPTVVMPWQTANDFYIVEVRPSEYNLMSKTYNSSYWQDYHTYYEQVVVPSRARAIAELPSLLAAREALVAEINKQ